MELVSPERSSVLHQRRQQEGQPGGAILTTLRQRAGSFPFPGLTSPFSRFSEGRPEGGVHVVYSVLSWGTG